MHDQKISLNKFYKLVAHCDPSQIVCNKSIIHNCCNNYKTGGILPLISEEGIRCDEHVLVYEKLITSFSDALNIVSYAENCDIFRDSLVVVIGDSNTKQGILTIQKTPLHSSQMMNQFRSLMRSSPYKINFPMKLRIYRRYHR